MNLVVKTVPELDPGFIPAVLWNKAYRERVSTCGDAQPVAIALVRPDKTCTVYETEVLPSVSQENHDLTLRYLERILKFLLWQRGGCRVLIAGCDRVAEKLADIYSPKGERAFDFTFFGDKTYLQALEISACPFDKLPESNEASVPLGRHLDGCRIAESDIHDVIFGAAIWIQKLDAVRFRHILG